MAALVRPAPVRQVLPVVAASTAGTGVVALAALGAAGHGGFATDPVGSGALAVAATAATVAAVRLTRSGHRAAGRLAAGLAASLLAYLMLTVLAVATVAAGHSWAGPTVAAWNPAWIPPLALLQLTASAAVRTGSATPWTHRAVGFTLGAVTLVNALLTTASEPFAGLPTIAGESWRTALAPVGTAATLLGLVALLLLPVTLWRAALGSHEAVRARLGIAAAATTAAPLTVAFCLLLAVVRSPGDVSPSLGSVAFLVALSGAALFAVGCAVAAARGAAEPRQVTVVVRVAGLAAASLLITGIGTIVAAPASSLGPTSVTLLVSALTVLIGGSAWVGTARLARTLTPVLPWPRFGPVDPAATSPAGTAVAAGRVAAKGGTLDAAPEDATSPLGAPGGGQAAGTGRAVSAAGAAGTGGSAGTGGAVSAAGAVAVGGLTARECEVLAALAEGASNAGIAAQLVVSERTVDAHLRAIFVKLDLTPGGTTNRRVQAARIWLEHAQQGP
ncbi:helix-turn-helix transcriptional regulator [Micromonospora sp. FIMYZ51]|uniref:helix-turn-helix transcriptional regulator n=1 Tax=Micromonospora sp. FIMYZ51 TaxID=3051832 RepID=UPI00311EF5D0